MQATLNEPYEVRFDKPGNMLWVEMKNHLVRRLDADMNGNAGSRRSFEPVEIDPRARDGQLADRFRIAPHRKLVTD